MFDFREVSDELDWEDQSFGSSQSTFHSTTKSKFALRITLYQHHFMYESFCT